MEPDVSGDWKQEAVQESMEQALWEENPKAEELKELALLIREEEAKKDRLDEEELLRLLCVVHFNCFSSGLYLHLAIINHSCRPNCVKNFVKEV